MIVMPLTCEEACEELHYIFIHFSKGRSPNRDELTHRLIFSQAETTRHFILFIKLN